MALSLRSIDDRETSPQSRSNYESEIMTPSYKSVRVGGARFKTPAP